MWVILNQINCDQLDQLVCAFLRELAPERLKALALDGKVVRSTRPDEKYDHKLNLFSALSHSQALVYNQVAVEDKSNEIPAVKTLLDPLDIDGVLVTADALHTQRETAQYIVQEKGAQYLFTVKDNQKGLRKRIDEALSGHSFSHSPSHG